MSRVIPFRRKYFRQNEIIQHCFSLERKGRLIRVVAERPWANALDRLIRERRGLTKARIAELAKDEDGKPMRPGQISKIAAGNSDQFLMSFLVRIAEAITKHDREGNNILG